MRLEERIIATRATTTEGMAAKARCAETMDFEPGLEDFSVSIAQDLLALMKASAAATAPSKLPPGLLRKSRMKPISLLPVRWSGHCQTGTDAKVS